jgi:hypothetical protein
VAAALAPHPVRQWHVRFYASRSQETNTPITQRLLLTTVQTWQAAGGSPFVRAPVPAAVRPEQPSTAPDSGKATAGAQGKADDDLPWLIVHGRTEQLQRLRDQLAAGQLGADTAARAAKLDVERSRRAAAGRTDTAPAPARSTSTKRRSRPRAADRPPAAMTRRRGSTPSRSPLTTPRRTPGWSWSTASRSVRSGPPSPPGGGDRLGALPWRHACPGPRQPVKHLQDRPGRRRPSPHGLAADPPQPRPPPPGKADASGRAGSDADGGGFDTDGCGFDGNADGNGELAGEGGLAARLRQALLGGVPTQLVELGRSTRVVPTPLRRALTWRDGGCVLDGCDPPHPWTDAHHLRHWAYGGPTDLDNLVLWCGPHHTAVHEGGWELTRDKAGRAILTPPVRGQPRHPPGG